MKVALVHDWLTGMRGGENCLEVFCQMFPGADIYTLIHIKGSVSYDIEKHKIHTSFIQRMPGASRRYRWYLPMMPKAIESFELKGYDLVLSSSHCVAKGVRPQGAPHLCYCHTPMRYAWDMYGHYFNRERYSWPTLLAIEKIMPGLRRWDQSTVSRVDRFVANSRNVAERIKRIYGAESEVIYPPVDVDFYRQAPSGKREGYLVVSAFAPYKKIDLAIKVFNERKERLIIVGDGEDRARLKAMAGPDIEFYEPVSRERLRELYSNCKALIYPGEEDFGIIPVEAMACGTPVIAYGKGGALETVIPLRDSFTENPTGVYFDSQTVDSLNNAIDRFENGADKFKQETLRRQASTFSAKLFREKMEKVINDFLS
ncbi:Glycosyltransferase [hydrothermal vent metagenome]|uniref:Glycosyltransferase n=1 Tax=hydrothermal vent metagenome TaxID=652676 RepID=A0A3B1CGP7_9ZZZZ